MTILRLDAEEGEAPGHVLTLTSRDPVTDAGAYRQACAVFWRAFRRRWGHVEYCGFVEWTTGEGPRSGGHRRMHSHWLVKGLATDELGEVEAWVSAEWAKLTGAWVVQLAELQTVGGVVGYLALHHEKLSQAPPEGWSGKRFRPSQGYFYRPVSELRERARAWLSEHRARKLGADDGALIAEAQKPAPRVVWQRTELRRSEEALTRGSGWRFDSLPARVALDAQLRRGAALRAAEDDEDRFERIYREGLIEIGLRRRAALRLRRTAGGVTGTGREGPPAVAASSHATRGSPAS